MEKTDTGFVKERDNVNLFNHIFSQAQGVVLELSAAPTATAPILKPNQIGQQGNDLYWRIADVVYKFSSDDQITITSDET